MGSWSELCSDILELIVDRFTAIEDISNFGAVCQPWRSVVVEKWRLCIAAPWLMLAEKKDSDIRGFYSLSTKKVYHLKLPEARDRKCWSSNGWLITLGLDLEFHLLNPFSRSRDQIRLPPQPTLPGQYKVPRDPLGICQFFMGKVILSSKPTCSTITTIPCEEEDDARCVVMAICCEFRKLAFLRLGEEAWTPIHNSKAIVDVIYFNGQFYATNYHAELLIVDISTDDPKMIKIAEAPKGIDICAQFYLVESVGELFMVAKNFFFGGDTTEYTGTYVYETDGFEVYRFNFVSKEWTEEMESLDNHAMFVGHNSSFSLSPSNHLGCEPNTIYYTDTDDSGKKRKAFGAGGDMGLYRVDKEEFDNHYVGPDMFSIICPPIWICPSQER